MPDETSRPYVLKLRNELHRYAQDLLRENEKLRAVTASLESDRRQLELELLQARDAAELRDDSRRNVEILEKEMLRMAAELATARDERDRYNCELTTLRDNLSSIESENRKYVELYQEIEQHSSNLANLYVSSYQLHSTVAREEVLGRILEIVINLIGSEEVGIFEAGDGAEVYTLSASMGIDGDNFAQVSSADTHLGTRIVAGETFVAPNGSDEPLTACIPLKIEDKVIGAIVIFRLLAHKSALEPLDFELMELLATHAATSLHCANLHGRAVLAVAS